jgi:C1A family cysteine protease
MKPLFKHVLIFLILFFQIHSEITEEQLQHEFQNFKTSYQKSYRTNLEERLKYLRFKQNYITLKNLQKDPNADFGVTQFFDLSQVEFKNSQLTLSGSLVKPITENPLMFGALSNPSWDWRSKGVVTPPRNQGVCGSCFIFSALANLESQYAMKHNGAQIYLSTQQVLSCANYRMACVGGLMEITYNYLQKAGGAILEQTLPYSGRITQCPYPRGVNPVVKVTGYNRLPTTDETQIANYLVQIGPLATGIHGDLLYYYKSGIITTYCPSKLNHAVLIVGYGASSNGIPYWIIKNSWGTTWGEGGYFRIKRGIGQCGINRYVITGYIQ